MDFKPLNWECEIVLKEIIDIIPSGKSMDGIINNLKRKRTGKLEREDFLRIIDELCRIGYLEKKKETIPGMSGQPAKKVDKIGITFHGKNYFNTLDDYYEDLEFDIKLPSNARKLLKEIILCSGDRSEMIKNKFESAEQDEDELTGILKQLKDIGFINIFWADDIPYDVKLEYLGKTYFETAKSIKKTERVIEPRIGSVYTGNMVVGDVINSSLSNSTNITFIENRIDAEGGEDKEELRELLKEAKEAIENFQESGEIKENENFSKKARRHLEKYPWFYSGLMNLMGTAAMKIFLGS